LGIPLALIVNGEKVATEVDPSLSLLRFLREGLLLAGAKNGCEKGHCGACTVIVDGKAKRSCLLKAARLGGSTILTIEGLAKSGETHPIQRAFVLEGAVQCGFCTPGMIMATKALLDRVASPSDTEIAEALKDNLCRCTGYAAIRRAVQRAARELRGEAAPPTSFEEAATDDCVGLSLPRKEAPAKTRGEALFAEDLADRWAGPGGEKALVGKMLFSERTHAVIKSADISRAAASACSQKPASRPRRRGTSSTSTTRTCPSSPRLKTT